MFIATTQRTFTDPKTGEETLYTYAAEADTEALALQYVTVYASMVEYAVEAEKWVPGEMPFPEEHLYQFMSPQTLEQMKAIYADVVPVAYNNALAYVSSYIGNMFDIEAMLASGDSSSTALTLRLALCLSTASFILASVAQYSDVTASWNEQLRQLLKGLKAGSRNFGKAAIISEPDARVRTVSLSNRNKNGRP